MSDKLTELLIKAQGHRTLNNYARQASVDAGNLSRIMKGQKPSPEVLRKLADKAQNSVTYEELMEAAGYLDEVVTENSSNQIKEAIGDDPELLEFWNELTTRDDLLLMFKQARKLPSDEIKRIIRYIKAIEDEEAEEDY